jgi:hypothetical protein
VRPPGVFPTKSEIILADLELRS